MLFFPICLSTMMTLRYLCVLAWDTQIIEERAL